MIILLNKIILIIKYIIISIIQGIGEILPISSSGHMIIIKTILRLNENDLTFEIFLHSNFCKNTLFLHE